MGVHYRDDQAGYALETSKAKQVVPCERQRGADEEVEDAEEEDEDADASSGISPSGFFPVSAATSR